MINKKNSRLSDFGEAKDGKNSSGQTINHTNRVHGKKETVKATLMTDRVRSLLPTGRANAIHVREIEDITGLSDRDIRKTVEALRIKGTSICGDDAGLYLPANIEELQAWERHRTATARAIYRTTAAARRTIRKYKRNNPDHLGLDDLGLL